MPRYENVRFEFLSAAYVADESHGTVLVRDQEMILEIECPGERPYLIRGKPRGAFFAGRHEGYPEDVRITAKWTRLDDIFIGTWVEDGLDFVFTFRLPLGAGEEASSPARRRSKARRKKSDSATVT